MLELIEHASHDYKSRTVINATDAVTAAFGVHFDAREDLHAAAAAGDRYACIPLTKGARERIQPFQLQIVVMLKRFDSHVLNVTGNSVGTLSDYFQCQADSRGKYQPAQIQAHIDRFVLEVIKGVHMLHPLHRIHSGGQTGVDEAGIKAALELGIDVRVVMPKDYRIRTVSGDDFSNRSETLARFGAGPQHLLRKH